MKKDDWELILMLHDYPNLTKSAGKLFLSQPALTKRLQQIEEEFGVAIVNRNSKGITFTPEGEYLTEQAEKFIALMHDTRNYLERMKDGTVGGIKIGSPTSFARSNLPQILNRYRVKYPKVDLRVQVAVSGEIPKLVQQQDVHVGFVNGDHVSEADQFLCSTGKGYIVSANPITLEELPKRPMIRFYRDSFSRNLVNEWWKNHFNDPQHVGMEVIDIDTCREMLRNGLGYSVIYSNYLREGDESFYKIPMHFSNGAPVIRNTWMIHRKDYSETPIIRNFVDYIMETMGSMVIEEKRMLDIFD